MVKREIDGEMFVAVRRYSNAPAKFTHPTTYNEYVFLDANGVSMAWVREYDAEHLILMRVKKCNCGGGSYANLYSYAPQNVVNVWESGHY